MTGNSAGEWIKIGCLCVSFVAFLDSNVFAIQLHGDPEGLFVHQIAHVFFIISMATLIYWLFRVKIIFHKGWRFIGVAAVFFILWNIDAFVGHAIEGSKGVAMVIEGDSWSGTVRFSLLTDSMAVLYYLLKLDHLLCVPGIVSFYFGLKELSENSNDCSGCNR